MCLISTPYQPAVNIVSPVIVSERLLSKLIGISLCNSTFSFKIYLRASWSNQSLASRVDIIYHAEVSYRGSILNPVANGHNVQMSTEALSLVSVSCNCYIFVTCFEG